MFIFLILLSFFSVKLVDFLAQFSSSILIVLYSIPFHFLVTAIYLLILDWKSLIWLKSLEMSSKYYELKWFFNFLNIFFMLCFWLLLNEVIVKYRNPTNIVKYYLLINILALQSLLSIFLDEYFIYCIWLLVYMFSHKQVIVYSRSYSILFNLVKVSSVVLCSLFLSNVYWLN